MSRSASLFAGLSLASIYFPVIASACIWVNGSTLDGRPISHNSFAPFRFRLLQAMDMTPADKLRDLEKSSKESTSDKREEEAVREILSGTPQAAIPMLQRIEEEEPGNYSTAANLGTAYELAGDNQNALKWITEGIRRNSESHHGTEWLHALILETKLRLESDPDYLTTHRIIDLPEVFSRETKIQVGNTERTISEVMLALGYQLRERVVFVKPPDPIVADLLFTYGICEAHTTILENAIELLRKSEEYGFQDPALLKSTEARYQATIRVANVKRFVWRAGIALVVVGGVWLLYHGYRRKWFFLTTAAHRKYLAEKLNRKRNAEAVPREPY